MVHHKLLNRAGSNSFSSRINNQKRTFLVLTSSSYALGLLRIVRSKLDISLLLCITIIISTITLNIRDERLLLANKPFNTEPEKLVIEALSFCTSREYLFLRSRRRGKRKPLTWQDFFFLQLLLFGRRSSEPSFATSLFHYHLPDAEGRSDGFEDQSEFFFKQTTVSGTY